MCLRTYAHTSILMITVSVDFCNPISQKNYDFVINSLQLHQLTCSCGHSGCLTIHGYYYRSLKTENSTLRLRIRRVICSECGHTHALLPSFIVPYSQVSFFDQVEIIQQAQSDKNFTSIMNRTPSIDESNIRSIIRCFRFHWEQRLLSEQLSPTVTTAFVRSCFLAFHRQFMQIKNTPNIIFSPPT